jgi:TRAP-type mannitol/chloroaromatic compound transport system substrate-binding protein
MLQSHHQQVETFELIFNRTKFNALPNEMKAILRNAAFAATADQFAMAQDRYSKDFEEIKRRGVQVHKTPDPVLAAQLEAWNKVIAEQSKEPFFRKVVDSQKAWVKRTAGYLSANNLNSAALDAAYKHFFG